MKIAVSGAHRTGKTTLVGELAASLPEFVTIDEPYYQLVEEGHIFGDMPSVEDFELQLERSIRTLLEREGNCIFDRCPYDLLAYLLTHPDLTSYDLDPWLPEVRESMKQIDLVVYVPIEEPDRIPLADSEHGLLRRKVDDELREIILDDRFDLEVPSIEVAGTPGERSGQVLEYIAANTLANG